MADEQNIKSYYPVGQKTLLVFILKKSGLLFLMAMVLVAALFLLNYVPYNYLSYAIYAIAGYTALFLVVLASVFLVAWLQYTHYGVYLDQKTLKVRKGVLREEMAGIPYRRIEDVKIESSVFDQIFGVGDIIITLTGPEDDKVQGDLKMFLPSLQKNIALEIQDSILKLAQVEQINVLGG